MLKIIKIGGKLIENAEALHAVAADLAAVEGAKIIVHGGGVLATHLCEQLGIEQHLLNGRRLTDAATLDVTIMAYAGLANKRLTAALTAAGAAAVGLSGCDMMCVRSTRRPVTDGVDWGEVGDVEQVNAAALKMLLSQGYVPVLSPITCDAAGHLLNTNADSVAAAVAVAMSRAGEAVELIYCLDKGGVLRDVNDATSLIAEIDSAEYARLKTTGVIFAGMLPKLENSFVTLHAGVQAVRLTAANALAGGTVIKL